MSKQSKRERQRLNREARRQYEESLARRRRTMKTARTFAIFVVPVIVIGAVLSISGGGSGTSPAVTAGCREVKTKPKPKTQTFASAPPLTIDKTKTYVATMETSCGSFEIQLAASEAPQTVNSFAFLAQKGFFDGLTFHRIAKDFVIQGGDPKGDGTGGPGYTLPDEPPVGGYQKGTVAMANAGTGTTGSQFFVVLSDKGATGLGPAPYKYSILGQVTSGFEIVQRIAKLATPSQKPKATVLIDKVTVVQGTPGTTTTSGVTPTS